MSVDSDLCEKIARRWCELMKLDPDEVVTYYSLPKESDPFLRTFSKPRWKLTADKVPEQLAWVLAIEENV